jgi:hypothetical protein
MAFATRYRIEFDTIKGRSVKIDIEQDAFEGSITNLIAATENPIEIQYPNAEFEKMTGIRESRARVRILANNISAEDLLADTDTEFKIKVYVNGNIEWVGWLDNDYINEVFLDTGVVLEISANDGLSLIKEIELQGTAAGIGFEMWGLYRIKEFITNCLKNTELGLDYWSFINMYPVGAAQRSTNNDFDAFYYAHATSFTFIEGYREFNDCYSVLSKIMQAFGCTLFQARGAWYIIQTLDRIADDLDGNRRNSNGTAQQSVTNQSFAINVGLDEDTKLVNADAVLSYEKRFKHSIINHRYKMPPVFFRNFDLLDGDFNAPLSTSTRQVYDLQYWENAPIATPPGSMAQEAYIGVDIDTATTAELRRYLLFYTVNFASTHKAVKTTDYYVNAGDKLTFSFSTREKNARFIGSEQWNWVYLLAANGDFYTLNQNGKWIQNAWRNVGYVWNNLEDRRFWKDFSVEAEPFPVNGALSIIMSSYQNPGQTNIVGEQIYYKDLNLTIQNYFNDMLSVDGYEYKNYQDIQAKNVYDNEIFLSRSDNIGTQGALLSSTYTQLNQWKYYNANDNTAVDFAKYIARMYWRTMYRNFKRLEGRLFNIYAAGRMISPLNTLVFSVYDSSIFMLTTLNIDLRNEQAEFTSIELKSVEGDWPTLIGDESFKYLNVKALSDDELIKAPRMPIDYRFGQLSVLNSLIRNKKRRRFNNYS